jgi:hypothetical protein
MSVRQRVLDVLDSTELSDPHAIADAIAADLRGAAAKEALAECLPQYVRVVLSSLRSNARLDPATWPSHTHEANAGSSRSSKWMAARDFFRQPIHAAGEWRQLGDLTVDEVAWLVDDRHRQAKELTIAADRFAALRDLMTRRKAKRVRDLPEDEVAGVLS